MKLDVTKMADIEKEGQFEKEIMDLVKSYGWELENTSLSLLDINYVILVKTNFNARSKRSYPEINEFRDKVATILQKYGLTIQTFESDDKTRSNDLKYRRIEIEILKGKRIESFP